MKFGYTLMELLVIIGIIAILISGACKYMGISNPLFENNSEPERTYVYDSNGHVIVHEN